MEAMEIESSQKQAMPDHLSEHCYSKICMEGSDAMDTDKPPPVSGTDETTSLTKLNQGQDTFETILLLLLRTFTSHQRKSTSGVSSPMAVPRSEASPYTDTDISAEALSTLSSEQVMALVTSNSVNYEVIQQIIAKKQKEDGNGSQHLKMNSRPDVGGSNSAESVDVSKQLLQVTPEQLQQIQMHITGLLQQQKVTIPAELSAEQQLELIQSMLVQQLNVPAQTTSEGPDSSTEPPKTEIKPAVSTTIKHPSKPQTKPPSSKAGSAFGYKKKTKKELKEPNKPPKPYNIFYGEVYSTVMAANPTMPLPDTTKLITSMWDALGDEVKKRYNEVYEKLQQEYQVAMTVYQASKQETKEPPSTLQFLLTKDPQPKPHPLVTSAKTDPKLAVSPSVSPASPVKMEVGAPALLVAGEMSQLAQDSVGQVNVERSAMVLNNPPIDSKTCVNGGCTNAAVCSDDRGKLYCSSECVVKHCRSVFDVWVSNRKVKV